MQRLNFIKKIIFEYFKKNQNFFILLSLILLGSIHGLSFCQDPMPSWTLGSIQVLSFSWLIHTNVNAPNKKSAFTRAFFFSCSNFCVVLHWVFFILHKYATFGKFLSAFCLFLLSSVLSLYSSTACWLNYFLSKIHGKNLGIFFFFRTITWASIWLIFEWLRGTFLLRFPWANIGFSHVSSPISGFAPLIGTYGLGFISVICSALIANTFCKSYFDKNSEFLSKRKFISIILLLFILLVSKTLMLIKWADKGETVVDAYLVQSNIDEFKKFDFNNIEKNVSDCILLATSCMRDNSDLSSWIVLPETVLAKFQYQLSLETWENWIKILSEKKSVLILGIPINDYQSRYSGHYTNSAVSLNSSTSRENFIKMHDNINRYDKKYLVPIGEFVPIGLEWLSKIFQFPFGNFKPGEKFQDLFIENNINIIVNICYENLFPQGILPTLRKSSLLKQKISGDIIINMSNLSWFGNTLALRQHLQINQLLALQLARPLLSVSNTGITAVIDSSGSVIAQMEPNKIGVLKTQIQSMQGLTPYTVFGDYPILALAVLVLFINFFFAIKK